MVPSFSRLVLILLISVIALTDKREYDSEISVFYESPWAFVRNMAAGGYTYLQRA